MKMYKTNDPHLPPSALPELLTLAREVVKYNTGRKKEDWLVILPQVLMSTGGHLKVEAVAIPTELAHAIMALVESQIGDCYVLTAELMKNHDNPLAEYEE